MNKLTKFKKNKIFINEIIKIVEIQKFDHKIHNSSKVAELINNSTNNHNNLGLLPNELNTKLSSNLVNRNLLFDNIYLFIKDNQYLGVIIFSYCRKSIRLSTLIKLLVCLKLSEFFEKLYLSVFNSNIEIGAFDAYLDLIYIDPGFRNKGNGTLLINKLIKLIKIKNKQRLVLHVDTDNIIARGFYEKLGFEYSINPQDTSSSKFLEMAYKIN